MKAKPALAIYLAVALVTFGHSASSQDPSRLSFDMFDNTAKAAWRGTVAATFWPLYWSWVAFEGGNAK